MQFVPRSVLVDMEPGVLDSIRGGKLRDLFKPDHMLNGKFWILDLSSLENDDFKTLKTKVINFETHNSHTNHSFLSLIVVLLLLVDNELTS